MKYEILINFPKVMGNGKRNAIILTKKRVVKWKIRRIRNTYHILINVCEDKFKLENPRHNS